MISLLNNAPNFKYSNYSVPENKAFPVMSRPRLEDEIRGQIRPANVVIIIAGMYAAHSDWIQFEIDFAKAAQKPIVGVRPRGQERVPMAVTMAADRMVNWNTQSVVDAVRELT